VLILSILSDFGAFFVDLGRFLRFLRFFRSAARTRGGHGSVGVLAGHFTGLIGILRVFGGVWWLFGRFAVILVLILCHFGAFLSDFS
jgi:hypothetical protein